MDGQFVKQALIDFNNVSGRDRTFDLLKLYAMLSVVLDHTLSRWIAGDIQTTQLYNWIFISQMPIFMFVAGYFSQIGINKSTSWTDCLRKIVKTIESMMIPFITFAAFSSVIIGENILFSSFLFPQKSLWFLWALMWMQVLMLISQQISKILIKKANTKVFVSIGLYVVELIPIGVFYLWKPGLFDTKLIIFYSVFFLFGYFYSFIENKLNFLKTDKFKMACIPVLVVIVAFIMTKHPTVMYESENIKNILSRFVGSFSAVLLMLYLSSFAVKLKPVEKVAAFGVFSLEMYYMHLLLMRFSLFNTTIQSIGFFLIKYILLVAIALIVIVAVKSSWILDFVIFGKRQV